MGRKGDYTGGGTSIGPRDTSWFTKESTQVPRDESAPRPERSSKEQAEYEAFKRAATSSRTPTHLAKGKIRNGSILYGSTRVISRALDAWEPYLEPAEQVP